ncbi:hypothetical protein LY76DRAFT_607022 [Colletotrichum caudatum]|nr:hypothetical protein LY76DRAFT_607022 [Colletotrichum caudatum]
MSHFDQRPRRSPQRAAPPLRAYVYIQASVGKSRGAQHRAGQARAGHEVQHMPTCDSVGCSDCNDETRRASCGVKWATRHRRRPREDKCSLQVWMRWVPDNDGDSDGSDCHWTSAGQRRSWSRFGKEELDSGQIPRELREEQWLRSEVNQR